MPDELATIQPDQAVGGDLVDRSYIRKFKLPQEGYIEHNRVSELYGNLISPPSSNPVVPGVLGEPG